MIETVLLKTPLNMPDDDDGLDMGALLSGNSK